MGVNNWLVFDRPPGGQVNISFRYGTVWEIQYSIGDKISWEGRSRPAGAEGVLFVPGAGYDDEAHAKLHGRSEYGTIDTPLSPSLFTHYKIRVEDDVIKEVTVIDEAEYEALDEAILKMLEP